MVLEWYCVFQCSTGAVCLVFRGIEWHVWYVCVFCGIPVDCFRYFAEMSDMYLNLAVWRVLFFVCFSTAFFQKKKNWDEMDT